MRLLTASTLAAVACLTANLQTVTADDLTISRTAVAVQTITVPGYSPLGALLPPESQITASGPLDFEFTDNPPQTTLIAADFSATQPFPFVLTATDFPGVLVKDGDRFVLTAVGGFEVDTLLPLGPGGELVALRLFTIEDAVFVGDVPGVGFPAGTLFSSPDSIPLGLEVDGVVLTDADGHPIPMAFSSNRTVTIVNPSDK